MEEEIARFSRFEVRRTADKDFLWDVRSGNFEYDELLGEAESKIKNMDLLFKKSKLL